MLNAVQIRAQALAAINPARIAGNSVSVDPKIAALPRIWLYCRSDSQIERERDGEEGDDEQEADGDRWWSLALCVRCTGASECL